VDQKSGLFLKVCNHCIHDDTERRSIYQTVQFCGKLCIRNRSSETLIIRSARSVTLLGNIIRSVDRILHGGGAEGCTFFSKTKKWTTFLVVTLKPTLLVERTVLLYWIKQAVRPNKDSFFPVKKSTQSTTGNHPPPARLRPWRFALPLASFMSEDQRSQMMTPVLYRHVCLALTVCIPQQRKEGTDRTW